LGRECQSLAGRSSKTQSSPPSAQWVIRRSIAKVFSISLLCTSGLAERFEIKQERPQTPKRRSDTYHSVETRLYALPVERSLRDPPEFPLTTPKRTPETNSKRKEHTGQSVTRLKTKEIVSSMTTVSHPAEFYPEPLPTTHNALRRHLPGILPHLRKSSIESVPSTVFTILEEVFSNMVSFDATAGPQAMGPIAH